MSDALTPMMQQYHRLKREIPPDAMLLFRLGDFYEMFFADAEEGSRLLDPDADPAAGDADVRHALSRGGGLHRADPEGWQTCGNLRSNGSAASRAGGAARDHANPDTRKHSRRGTA